MCSELDKDATGHAGKYLFRAANMWWRCAQYFGIASFGLMARDNICMYMVHVCFYACSSDCVRVCGNVCCVAVVIKNSVLALECSSMLLVFVGDVIDVVFYVCIVRREAVGARVWEV